MRIDEKMTRNLAHSADILNTIGGGTVFPTVNTSKHEDHYRLEMSVPSIDPEDIKVEVNGGHLFIYQRLGFGNTRLPNLLEVHKISADVELDNITAGYEDELLIVIMPFNELTGGFRKEIEILKN